MELFPGERGCVIHLALDKLLLELLASGLMSRLPFASIPFLPCQIFAVAAYKLRLSVANPAGALRHLALDPRKDFKFSLSPSSKLVGDVCELLRRHGFA
jgi:hypothetical protein